jgi:hypothetical protein
MLDVLEVVARLELIAVDDFLDGGDRSEQEPLFDGEAQQFRLGVAGGEGRDDFAHAIVFLERLRAADQHLPVGDPVLVARRLVAPSLLAQVVHQLAREDAERGAEQEGAGDPSVLGRPQKLHLDLADLDAARDALDLVRIQGRRQNVRLGRERERLLRRDIYMLPHPGAASLMMRHQRGDCRIGARVQVSLRYADAHGRAVVVAGDAERAAGRHYHQVAVRIRGLGAVLPERSDRNIDEARIDRAQVLVSGAEPVEAARRFRLDQEMRAADQADEQFASFAAREIERDAALVAVV